MGARAILSRSSIFAENKNENTSTTIFYNFFPNQNIRYIFRRMPHGGYSM